MNQRCTPAAELRMIQREGDHVGMFFQNRMHRAPQVADAFAVDDSHLENPPLPAGGEIIQHKFLHLARLEGVQVEHAINGQLQRFGHGVETTQF